MQGKGLIIGILIYFLFVIFSPFKIYAQDAVVQTDTPLGVEKTSTESSDIEEDLNYELAYPGMLPDHPFYFLKVIRDGIVKFLINDDLKRARFSLLSGEKRYYSGKFLLDKNKDAIAITSISKGNNYLDEAISAIENAKKHQSKNTDIKPFLYQFKASSNKMEQILTDYKIKIDKKLQRQYEKEKNRLEAMQQKADRMLRQK